MLKKKDIYIYLFDSLLLSIPIGHYSFKRHPVTTQS